MLTRKKFMKLLAQAAQPLSPEETASLRAGDSASKKTRQYTTKGTSLKRSRTSRGSNAS